MQVPIHYRQHTDISQNREYFLVSLTQKHTVNSEHNYFPLQKTVAKQQKTSQCKYKHKSKKFSSILLFLINRLCATYATKVKNDNPTCMITIEVHNNYDRSNFPSTW